MPTKVLGRAACRPLLWISADAMTCTGVDPAVTAHPDGVPSIASVGDRVVAVGGASSESPARYTLRSQLDGSWRWQEEAGPPRFEGIVGVPGAFMATSHLCHQVGLSSSPDGRTWSVVEGVPAMSGRAMVRDSDIVAFDDRVIITGWREDEAHPDQAGFAIVGPLDGE